ncbi:MAG: hypothetical protein V8T51_08170 [Senegalimassilia faecalis]
MGKVLRPASAAAGEGDAVVGVPAGGVVAGSASLSLDGEGVSDAAAAMAKATVEAKTLAEEREIVPGQPLPEAVAGRPEVPRLAAACVRRRHHPGAFRGGLPRVRLQRVGPVLLA